MSEREKVQVTYNVTTNTALHEMQHCRRMPAYLFANSSQERNGLVNFCCRSPHGERGLK